MRLVQYINRIQAMQEAQNGNGVVLGEEDGKLIVFTYDPDFDNEPWFFVHNHRPVTAADPGLLHPEYKGVKYIEDTDAEALGCAQADDEGAIHDLLLTAGVTDAMPGDGKARVKIGEVATDTNSLYVVGGNFMLMVLAKFGVGSDAVAEFLSDNGVTEFPIEAGIYPLDRVTVVAENGGEMQALLVGAPAGNIKLK